MNVHKYREMLRYITKPRDNLSVNEKKKIVKDFYKKAEQPKSKPMPITKYIDTMNRLYGNAKTDEYGNPETATTRIQEQDRQKKAKPKKIVEKPKPKPTYLNGNVIDLMPFLPDEEWWKIFEEEPPKEKVLLRVPRRKLKGLASLLNVG